PNLPAASSMARRYERFPADIRVSVEVFRPGGTASLWGRTSEIGEDGVGATLTGEVTPGEVVSMQLLLPGPAVPLRVRGLARYRTGLRHGFEFLTLSPSQHDVLRQLCEALASSI